MSELFNFNGTVRIY